MRLSCCYFLFIRDDFTIKHLDYEQQARDVVRQHHIRKNPALVNSPIIDIAVSFDGSWHRRGHKSLYGFAAVIEFETGHVIDYVVLSKYCYQCELKVTAYGGEDNDEFQDWFKDHQPLCNRNFPKDEPSCNMEVAAAKLLWGNSEANGFR